MDIDIPKGISVKQETRFGKPCIEGTRIAIVDLLNLLKMGYSIKEIPAQYPGVTLKQVKTALDYAAKIIGKEEVLEINSAG
ncbi:MAG: DUF433 domain-containing protein [Candidatus Pacebacteria bacterium]|jgi:uncharacterized protein (DUF433 family)|nr:DUF433 domain-containing protein [Candidatus Paceibacterota bacterium]